MTNQKIISREKVEERIPFCYGILQRIADDLEVSRTAVHKFLNKPENADLLETVKSEKKTHPRVRRDDRTETSHQRRY